MTVQVLSLNDTAVTLADVSGLRCVSPACVLTQDGQTLFGQQAAAQSRLYPLQSNNAFWAQLSMDPLPRPMANFRHHADMAYAHLLHLAQEADAEGDVLMAVPGSFSREQLSILLGILQHSPFRAAGLVDLATVALAHRVSDRVSESATRFIHVDLQLHQMVCTSLRREGDRLQRDQVLVIAELGWAPLSNALVQLVTDAFIRQCRFNPQHSAAWEQHLYNELPGWLLDDGSGGSNLSIELNTGSVLHQAKLTRDAFGSRLHGYYRRLLEQLQLLAEGSGVEVLLSERCATLPGLSNYLVAHLPAHIRLVSEAVGELQLHSSVLEYAELLNAGGQLTLVKQLQLRQPPEAGPIKAPDQAHATLQVMEDGRLRLNCRQQGVLVNGHAVAGEVLLTPGDRLSTLSGEVELRYG
jgi:GTP cyclohydrolase II